MSRLGKRQLHELYYYLKLTRRLEQEVTRLCREGKGSAPMSFTPGVEAVGVAAAYRLSPEDWLGSSLSSLGPLLARGVQPLEIFAHLMGRDSGPSGGRDVALPWGDTARHLVAPTGHPATHVGVMAGVALAAKTLDLPAVGVALVEAKCLAAGDFHEGLNFAATHQLPLVVVVENDPFSPASVLVLEGDYLYERTRGYGVPGLPVDGSDVLQVLQVIETAIDRAREGKGPTLVEARTRHAAELDSDEASAGERGEDPGFAGDPVQHFETFLVDRGLVEPVERGLILDRIEQLVASDLGTAENDPFPEAEQDRGGVYKEAGARPG